MIDIDVSNALKQLGDTLQYRYTGCPDAWELEFISPVSLQADYSSADGVMVHIKGSYSATILQHCTRCLDEVKFELAHDFNELYVPAGQADDQDRYTYTGKTVSLDKMVYDSIVLAIPQQILCREDCSGLCAQCGVNLNKTTCSCAQNALDENNPFAALKNLFEDNE